MRQALGLVEAIGLATAIEAADAAVKSANVTLVGLEPAKGDGMHTIKLLGDVGAVKAGVEAASVACDKGRGVFSVKVIPRPDSGIDALIANDQTLGIEPDILKNELGIDSWGKVGKYSQLKPTEGKKTPIEAE